ncbi:MAG TPA: tetratricopeptide repeat protein [Bacteroidia bacterium]|nr:tetratricopeptide repeat protein [Bacteroidia bacterium]
MNTFMKITGKAVILFFILYTGICNAQKYRGEFAKTEFSISENRLNFFVNMFETKKQLLNFMEINKGDVIAEVGAGNGWNLGVLSMIYDSLTLYAQDINPKDLSESAWKKTITYYEKHRATKQTNKFNRVIGTTSSTNLPDGIFDKILLVDAYHDFDKKDAIIDDMAKKLKPGGKIYILDGFSFPGDTQICPDNGKHILTTLPVEVKRFEKHGFYLTKMRSPDFRSHYGQGLIFERDKNRSDEFYSKKEAVDPLVKSSARIWKNHVASDSVAMKDLADSLLPKIKEITDTYKEYEVWIKDIGLMHLRKAEYKAAINIFKAGTRLFPDSYQAWYWLGVAYQENKQNKEALPNFKRSLSLKPDNIFVKKRITQAESGK